MHVHFFNSISIIIENMCVIYYKKIITIYYNIRMTYNNKIIINYYYYTQTTIIYLNIFCSKKEKNCNPHNKRTKHLEKKYRRKYEDMVPNSVLHIIVQGGVEINILSFNSSSSFVRTHTIM